MDNRKIKTDHILVIKNPLKKRMLRVINDNDYENADTEKMGFIFGLIDADMGLQNVKIFDIINEGIGRYYKNQLDYDIAFDDLINFLNRRILQMFPDQNIKDRCSALIGVLKDHKMLFCASGNINSFLIYPHGIKKIFPEESERTLDVSNKLFSYSLNGEVLKNYTIYFCNLDFKETVNPYNLEKAIQEAGAGNVIKSIKNYLLEAHEDGQYGSFWIYYGAEPAKNADTLPNSIMDVFKNEQKTQENLAPSIITGFNLMIKDKPFIAGIMNHAAGFLKITFNVLKKVLLLFGFLLFNSFFIITNAHGKRKEKQSVISNRFKEAVFKIKDFYNSFTAISKALFFSLLILLVALTGVIVYSVQAQKMKQLRLSYKQNADTASALYNEAESDVIYQQKNEAVKKLRSAIKFLQMMPEKIRDNDYNALLNKVRDRLYKIQNISEVSAPVLIADFSADTTQNIYPPIYLTKDKINLFSQDQVLTIGVKDQKIEKSQLKIMGLSGGIFYYYAPKSVLFSIENGNALQISHPDTLISDLKEITLHPNEVISKFAVYNDIMYALSPIDKYFSIWKHNPSLSGFGKPSLWATDNIPEGSNASSFALDGSLYILFSNNQIYKYYQGRKTDWKYDATEAPDNAAYSIILTNENYHNIYLAGKNTVSVISKDGDFLAHILLPTLNDIRDIVVDETAGTIYVLDGKKIFAFSFRL